MYTVMELVSWTPFTPNQRCYLKLFDVPIYVNAKGSLVAQTMLETLSLHIVERWSPRVFQNFRVGLSCILYFITGSYACISFPFLVLLHDLYMLLVSICLAYVPCCLTSYISLCIMCLFMFICYVVLRISEYGHVLVHVLHLYMLMLKLCHTMIFYIHYISWVGTT